MTQKRVLNIFFEGLKIYCLNIHKFTLYMLFPVLGQLLGTVLILAPIYLCTQNFENISGKLPMVKDLSMFLIFMLVISLPGLIILIKAFCDYLIAYGALCSMTEGYLNTGKVYDFKSHREVVLNKPFAFSMLWIIFSLYMLISLIPIFWILGFIFFIYFILIFQVFTFESGLSPIGYFRRSFELVKGNFGRTFLLMAILSLLTYYLLPEGVNVIFDASNITNLLSKPMTAWAFTLPIEKFEQYGLTPMLISQSIIKQLAAFLAVSFTLPLRSICWTLWYNNLSSNEEKTSELPKKSKSKKSKSFKIEKRELDPEIIRRARLEDDEY